MGHPLAIEVPPKGHKRYVEIVDFNMKMVADALGQLPPIAEDDFIVMSVAKSHSSQASRCVLLEVPHDNDKITENGKLSLHKIEAQRPEYAYAIKQGFEWEVLAWEAEDRFGADLIDLLQDRQYECVAVFDIH